MKKKISRIWSVGLILMMCVSLLFWVAPVSADTLEWDDEDEPDEFEAIDIEDMAVSAGGLAIYIVAGTATMYASGDTGESWEDPTIITDPADLGTILNATFVAVAPDDPQYVAVAADLGTTNATVYITEDSGATWDSLGAPNEDNFSVMDVAVSMESGDNRFVAVAGVDGSTAEVWYYEIGALGAAWEEITDGSYTGWADDQEIAAAVAFSPNFNSDEILLVVTQDDGNNRSQLEVFSFNTETWNSSVGGFSSDYPLDLDAEEVGTITDLVAADIAPSPDYLGSDDDMRQVFVGLAHHATTSTDSDGIFFCDDDSVDTVEKDELIHSIDFDGTNLVAGLHDDVNVIMSDDPLEGEDASTDKSSSKKSPGGLTECVVAFAGGDVVVAGTVGDDSAFAVSEDLGDHFNDITLIAGHINEANGMIDFAVSADGSVKYLLTTDNTTTGWDMSLWRLDNDLWERVLFVADVGSGVANYIVRIAPDDPDVIYLADADRGNADGTTIYYSADGGQTKWHNRTSRYPIMDLAVETDGGVAYVLTESGYVSKSVNTGFTWGGKETSMQAGDYMIISLGEDLLLVGGDATDSVAYSTDGNESWTDIDEIEEGANVQVCATGLEEGDYIYASTAAADSDIYRWEIGNGEWEDDLGALPEGHMARGIGIANGILYVVSDNTVETMLTRFLDPSGDDAGDQSEAAVPDDAMFDSTPTALRISAGSTDLWAVDTASSDFYNFSDTVSLIGPDLNSPASGSKIPVNEISGDTADVVLTWESPSDDVAEFDFEVATDDEFDEKVVDATAAQKADVGDGDEGDLLSFVLSDTTYDLMPGETYYWRVKCTLPVESPWSEVWSFTVEGAKAPAPVKVAVPPAPEITVEMPAPEVTVTIPPVVTVPPAPAPTAQAYIWGIIVIGALLVIALIVLIIRTRRVV